MEICRHDLRTPEGIRRNNELGIKSFPTIAINGEVLFESFIPAESELLEAVYAASSRLQNGIRGCGSGNKV